MKPPRPPSPVARRWCEVRRSDVLISTSSSGRRKSLGRAMPPTPAPWLGRLLAQRLGAPVVVQAREPHADRWPSRWRGGLVYLERLKGASSRTHRALFPRRAGQITVRASRSPQVRYGLPAMIYVPRGQLR